MGGAVRDQLLGRPVTERDYVVVGATPEAMLALGFKPVGKEFPVFLHPETREEYALARTERKVGKGYKGFTFYAAPEITLEEDLKRRDLTINAIAQDITTGELIDPYQGQADLAAKILHHVSPAFAEDPVRILRIARFAARFNDFKVHPETLELMRQMVAAGEVNALVPERVWQEFFKALLENHVENFFAVLRACHALGILFPNFVVIDDAALTAIATISAAHQFDPLLKFAALCHFISPEKVLSMAKQLRAPQEYTDLAVLVVKYRGDYQNLGNSNAAQILKLLEHLDAFRRPARFEKFLRVCRAIDNHENSFVKLQCAYQAAQAVTAESFIAAGLQGMAIAQALKNEREIKIAQALNLKK